MIAHRVNDCAHRQPADRRTDHEEGSRGLGEGLPGRLLRGASKAIDWLCRAFGFEVRLKIEGEGGRIEHSELRFGEGLVMVGQAGGSSGRKPTADAEPARRGRRRTPRCWASSWTTRTRTAPGPAPPGKILEEPTTNDYGDDYWADRTYRVEDPEGHHWWFIQRVRDAAPRGR